jgi:hypothetical protein
MFCVFVEYKQVVVHVLQRKYREEGNWNDKINPLNKNSNKETLILNGIALQTTTQHKYETVCHTNYVLAYDI